MYSYLTAEDVEVARVRPYRAHLHLEGRRYAESNPRFLDSGNYNAPHLIQVDERWYIALAVASNLEGSSWVIGREKAVHYGPRARREFIPLTEKLVSELRSQANYQRYGKQSEKAKALQVERLAFIECLERILKHNRPMTQELVEAFIALGETTEVLANF
jgi:hypothetical protein